MSFAFLVKEIPYLTGYITLKEQTRRRLRYNYRVSESRLNSFINGGAPSNQMELFSALSRAKVRTTEAI